MYYAFIQQPDELMIFLTDLLQLPTLTISKNEYHVYILVFLFALIRV